MKSRSVVVIDDDEPVLASITEMLTLAGFQATGFTDPVDFLKRLPDLPMSCVITDVQLPRISGLTLIKRMTTLGYGHWPKVVISGHADIPMAVEAMRDGAVTFLEKPFVPDAFLAVVTEALANAPDRPPAACSPTLAVAQVSYATLTLREREVLAHVAAGRRTKEIGQIMAVSPRTVEVYRSAILRKMAPANFTALAALVAQGLGE